MARRSQHVRGQRASNVIAIFAMASQSNSFHEGKSFMATVAVTPEQDAVQLDVQIAAPRERVFQAITDPRQLSEWWGQKGMYRTTNWTTDLRPGGKWLCEGENDTDGKPFNVHGE